MSIHIYQHKQQSTKCISNVTLSIFFVCTRFSRRYLAEQLLNSHLHMNEQSIFLKNITQIPFAPPPTPTLKNSVPAHIYQGTLYEKNLLHFKGRTVKIKLFHIPLEIISVIWRLHHFQ